MAEFWICRHCCPVSVIDYELGSGVGDKNAPASTKLMDILSGLDMISDQYSVRSPPYI